MRFGSVLLANHLLNDPKATRIQVIVTPVIIWPDGAYFLLKNMARTLAQHMAQRDTSQMQLKCYHGYQKVKVQCFIAK